jgi:Cu/Ag efflux protein CusF
MTAAFQEGVPGGVMVGTYQETATVTAIDAASRKVTLVGPDGSKTVFKAGPEVINFDQMRVGDQVKATVVEQLVVFLREEGMPSSDGQATTVALAPKGVKPGVLMADTVEVTATVKSIDLNRHKATLEFPGGKSKTFPVRPDVDLTKVRLGEEVVIRTTEAMAIVVEKP